MAYLARTRATAASEETDPHDIEKVSPETATRPLESLDPLEAEIESYYLTSPRYDPSSRRYGKRAPPRMLPKFTTQVWGKTNIIITPSPTRIGGIPGFISRPNRGSDAVHAQGQMTTPPAADIEKRDHPTPTKGGRVIVVRKRRCPIILSDFPPVIVVDCATPEQRRQADEENKENRLRFLEDNPLIPTRQPTRQSKPFAPPAAAPAHEAPSTGPSRRSPRLIRLRDPRALRSTADKIRNSRGDTLPKTKL